MRIFKVTAFLWKDFDVSVNEWKVIKETPKTFVVKLEDTEKTLRRENLHKIDSSYNNTVDGVIHFYAFVTEENVEQYKQILVEKVHEKMRYFQSKYNEKMELLARYS